ncbi:phosphoenolpyruvate synthase [Oculatella sp. LEGE 06141]|uniref:putative PEP-binding protein n=1 Tax=Oculatella sp. LEGE 06141 TaxID=1828648 RepID=UPI001881E086|nr:phosphoenolpyruvate synthase [Oculatella sp. LEGE 06141]
MDNFYQFDRIQPTDRSVVGDKAFYLSLLAQRGCPVVPGLVISANLLREFLEQMNWLEPLFADLPNSSLHLDVNQPRQLQAIAQRIQQTIRASELPESWLDQIETAVAAWQAPALMFRPSLALQSGVDPTLSYRTGGLLEAQVGWVSREAIASGLKQVWAQLFRAKSLIYWQRSGLQLQQVKLAVVVQPLWSAIAAGDLQTLATQAEIRSVWGLGHALVWGESLPDRHIVDLASGQMKAQHLGSKTYAYYLELCAPSALPETSALLVQTYSCLQTYIISAHQQEQYALTPAQIQQLVQLTQPIRAEMGHDLRLEWLLCRPDLSAEPMIYVTQVNPQPQNRQPTFTSATAIAVTEADPPLAFAEPATSSNLSAPVVLNGLAASTGQMVSSAWVVTDPEQLTLPPPDRIILVAANITPDWLVWIERVAGIVTEQGGMTCHGAIVAREMGIPAVVGVANATRLLHSGDLVFVNGDRGLVYRLENEAALATMVQQEAHASRTRSAAPKAPLFDPALAEPPQARSRTMQLLINLSQPNGISQAAQLPVDGIGLLRAELMMLTALEQKHPSLWLADAPRLIDRIASQIIQFVDAFAPRPVYYRSLDLRSHEFRLLKGSNVEPETNPMLGLHGTFSYVVNPALFEIELAALRQVQQSGYTNLHLILPFVRTVEEFSFCRRRVMQAGLAQIPEFQLWIMAEVPSVLFLLPDYVKAGVQGIAIGTNDLTHLLLAIDRDQYQIASAFDQRHPAVMRAIQQLIQTANEQGIPCSVCGQIPSQYPETIERMVQWGATAVSVNPDAVDAAHEAIARAERERFLDATWSSVETSEL